MNTAPLPRLGKHQRALLSFCARNPGPHSLTVNRTDPAHAALVSLSRHGLLVRSTVGRSVFAELAEGENVRRQVAALA